MAGSPLEGGGNSLKRHSFSVSGPTFNGVLFGVPQKAVCLCYRQTLHSFTQQISSVSPNMLSMLVQALGLNRMLRQPKFLPSRSASGPRAVVGPGSSWPCPVLASPAHSRPTAGPHGWNLLAVFSAASWPPPHWLLLLGGPAVDQTLCSFFKKKTIFSLLFKVDHFITSVQVHWCSSLDPSFSCGAQPVLFLWFVYFGYYIFLNFPFGSL